MSNGSKGKSVAANYVGVSQSGLIIRFWSKCLIGDGCWDWKNNNSGRPKFDKVSAHRFSYWIYYGVDPGPLWVNHFCNNKRCVRPDHLYLGTPKENTRDSIVAGNHPSVMESEKINCKYGHPYDEANTYVSPDGSRRCRICRQECKRLHRQRKREAGLEYK